MKSRGMSNAIPHLTRDHIENYNHACVRHSGSIENNLQTVRTKVDDNSNNADRYTNEEPARVIWRPFNFEL